MSDILTIIACYNAENTIRETIESILNQNGRNRITIVVCDDCSTDLSVPVIQSLCQSHANLHLVTRVSNAGYPSIPRNTAIQYARANSIPFEFIAFCDSDDFWLPDKIQNQMVLFNAYPELGLVYSRVFFVTRNGHRSLIKRKDIKSLTKLLYFSHISLSSVVLRRSKVDHLFPLFDESPLLKAIEDTECWARLLSNGVRIASTTTTDFIYTLSDQSISKVSNAIIRKRMIHLYKTISKKNAAPFRSILFPLTLKYLLYLVKS